jgi:tRNA (mo5U34)-methyltransferase
MPRRTVRFRGFALTVELPEKVTAAVRRVVPGRHDATAPGPLAFAPVPPFEIDDRARQRNEWRDFVAAAPAVNATNGHDASDSEHNWYHTIELPDGSVTPGRFDHRPLVAHYGLPDDLHGKRALDVGSGDGFWVFELERRGAEVTSLDIETFADADLPAALHDAFVEHPVNLSFRRGIEIAGGQLGSKVKLVNQPVYQLDPEKLGTFDVVHAGDILLHLRDPALALQRLRAVTHGVCILADAFDPALDGLGAGPGLTRFIGGWDDVTWWMPALSTLVQMVQDAGFSDVAVLTTYTLGERDNPAGRWRAVMRARP